MDENSAYNPLRNLSERFRASEQGQVVAQPLPAGYGPACDSRRLTSIWRGIRLLSDKRYSEAQMPNELPMTTIKLIGAVATSLAKGFAPALILAIIVTQSAPSSPIQVQSSMGLQPQSGDSDAAMPEPFLNAVLGGNSTSGPRPHSAVSLTATNSAPPSHRTALPAPTNFHIVAPTNVPSGTPTLPRP